MVAGCSIVQQIYFVVATIYRFVMWRNVGKTLLAGTTRTYRDHELSPMDVQAEGLPHILVRSGTWSRLFDI